MGNGGEIYIFCEIGIFKFAEILPQPGSFLCSIRQML